MVIVATRNTGPITFPLEETRNVIPSKLLFFCSFFSYLYYIMTLGNCIGISIVKLF